VVETSFHTRQTYLLFGNLNNSLRSHVKGFYMLTKLRQSETIRLRTISHWEDKRLHVFVRTFVFRIIRFEKRSLDVFYATFHKSISFCLCVLKPFVSKTHFLMPIYGKYPSARCPPRSLFYKHSFNYNLAWKNLPQLKYSYV